MQSAGYLILYSLEELERQKQALGLRVRIGKLESCRYVYFRVFNSYGNEKVIDAYHSLLNWLTQRKTELNDAF